MNTVIRHIDFEVPDFAECDAGPTERLGYRSLVLAMGPVAYWRLGEQSGSAALDEAGSSHGVYTGGPLIGQPGALAWDDDAAVRFDGDNDHVALGTIGLNHPLQLAATNITCVVWFDQLSGGDAYQRIVDKSTGAQGANGYAFWADPASAKLAIHVNGNWYQAGPYTTNAWHCAAFVITASVYRIYLDGVELAGSWASGAAKLAPQAATYARIGTWNHSTAREWKGYLDEIALWNRALSSEEIIQLYQRGIGR